MPAASPVILSVGYLIERKGHHRAVSALAAIRRAGVDARLWIAGGPGREGIFETQIRQRVAELGLEPWVHFTGPVPHNTLPELMSAADVVCLASTREGWPNVVHEAIACGTPVVSTNVGGVPDLLPDERYGVIVPPGDQTALDHALQRALAAEWDRDTIAAWGQSRSWDRVAREVRDLLIRVITEVNS